MEIWDEGHFETVEVKKDGGWTVRLHGKRVEGLWTLVPAHLDGDAKNWLILKKRDEGRAARPPAPAVRPMLATPADRLPVRGEWHHEVKWDGYRALGVVRGAEAALVSRSGGDLSDRFPAITRALPHALRTSDCIVDGEVCALDDQGRSDFGLLQADGGPLVYYVFDLLELEREPVVSRPIEQRRELLEELVVADPRVRLSAWFEDGEALLAAVREHGLEGVVSKRVGSAYRPGKRSGDWQKVKTRNRDEFLIIGYTRGKGSREALGSLLLAEDGDEGLSYAGNVGSGLSEGSVARLLKEMGPLRRDSAPIEPAPRPPKVRVADVTWVEPRLRCKVEFAERTRDGRLRAPVFVGMAEPVAARANGGGRVTLSNPDKLFFPDDAITKSDLFAYYEEVAPVLVPHLRDRPFTMLRYPDGITGKKFFQKDAPSHMPKWIRRYAHEGISYLMVNDPDALLWVVNMGCIDLHPWLARCDRPERPDLVMFDLDPADETSFETVVEVAHLVREALGLLGLEAVPKTSGGKGMHVLVPVRREHDHDEVRGFVSAVARTLAQSRPDLITTKWRRTERHGVLIDANQNGLGRTTAGVYSVRPKPGGPVSTPLRWDEVVPGLDPAAFTMDVVVERIRRLGDVAEPLLSGKQRLP
jgi:bifunctional non-homologous end joining protein LigD